jgi:hypothetical protein
VGAFLLVGACVAMVARDALAVAIVLLALGVIVRGIPTPDRGRGWVTASL